MILDDFPSFTFQDQPVAGKIFRVDVSGLESGGRMRVLSGDHILYEAECPDPPCHDLSRVEFIIPREFGGKEIVVEAHDLDRNRALRDRIQVRLDDPDEL